MQIGHGPATVIGQRCESTGLKEPGRMSRVGRGAHVAQPDAGEAESQDNCLARYDHYSSREGVVEMSLALREAFLFCAEFLQA